MRRELLTVLMLATSCGGIETTAGYEQPFSVRAGAFKDGALPEGTNGPSITTLSSNLQFVKPGANGATIGGNVAEPAYSVGVRFADAGDGYWVIPAGALDPITPGERTWRMVVDVSVEAEPGPQQLEIVAFDAEGRPGPKTVVTACVGSLIPDNQNSCNPKAAPPLVVATLSWDTDADVDLTVIAPDGQIFDRSKRQLTENGKVVAKLEADGVAGCITDKRPLENFVFNEFPSLGGQWSFYANLFDACGKTAVTYTLTIYQRVDNSDGTFSQKVISTVHGDFVRLQANGGLGTPIFITSVGL